MPKGCKASRCLRPAESIQGIYYPIEGEHEPVNNTSVLPVGVPIFICSGRRFSTASLVSSVLGSWNRESIVMVRMINDDAR